MNWSPPVSFPCRGKGCYWLRASLAFVFVGLFGLACGSTTEESSDETRSVSVATTRQMDEAVQAQTSRQSSSVSSTTISVGIEPTVSGTSTTRRDDPTTASTQQETTVSGDSPAPANDSADGITNQTPKSSQPPVASSEVTPGVSTTTVQPTTAPTLSAASVQPAAATRQVVDQPYRPMALFQDVQIFHPSAKVELIGFHESNHDGARQLELLPSAVAPVVLESRERGTGSRTAADVVVDPAAEIRAPVTGTVLRAGGYILYCDHRDDFVVIEPDARPGWELKVLHISGVLVEKGQRVEAGVTVLAPAPTQLPFESQVDKLTAEPSWPHVHIELVDPSIPDRPSTGGGC